ncbi:hypothetical protein [Microvirga sesbaniae]|uniref:hypothetical protein n=1 Tax=Microvirga sesbaniae TaxID=681392 RepID=UPI0021CA8DC2|nr:hypothetical protein [Microvirga sp. HBU67692]
MHDKAADYRRQAQETRAVAKWLSLNDDRQRLLDDANRLEALAETEERQGDSLVLTPQSHEDTLFKRAEAAIAEASRLREARRQIQMRTAQQLERMQQIERELDPLFLHPYWELGIVRAIRAQAGNQSP